MNSMYRRHQPKSESGAALVELAVALPVLVYVLVGTIDFGRVFYTSNALSNAARAGAQYGARSLGNSGLITTMQTTATNAISPNTGVTAVASRLCQCATNAGVLSDTSPTPNDCVTAPSTTCPSASGKHRVITVTVTASKTFATISRYPGIPSNLSISRVAKMRVTE